MEHMDIKNLLTRQEIFNEIQRERCNQDEKWGEQNHPSVDVSIESRLVAYSANVKRLAEEYEIPTEERAKFLCDEAFRKKQGTWAHIAVEELAEVIGAQGDELRRGELVQLGAVIFAWIEAIDRKLEKS